MSKQNERKFYKTERKIEYKNLKEKQSKWDRIYVPIKKHAMKQEKTWFKELIQNDVATGQDKRILIGKKIKLYSISQIL